MPSKKKPVSVDSVKHKDKRKNIPTEELRDFVRDEEQKPKTVTYPGLLYARDPSLDPQLVWKGKDEQDRQQLSVPAVPIYIQEKIHPQAIIEDVRAEAKRREKETAREVPLNLFGDFNGLPADFRDRVDFYNHEGNWSNRMILGDSLLVMTSLAEKEGLKGQVQMIYIDPPYGIKFASNWQVSTRKRDVKDGKAEDATRQPEQIRAFRDTWELGIHSYLAYWRDRLIVARELLTETGSVFVQIGDENVHLIRCIMDEVFGSSNFVREIHVAKTGAKASATLDEIGDYLLWYAKANEALKYRALFQDKSKSRSGLSNYPGIQLPDGTRRLPTDEEREQSVNLPEGVRFWGLHALSSQSGGPNSRFPITFKGEQFRIQSGGWKTSEGGIRRLILAERVEATAKRIGFIRYLDDFPLLTLTNLWDDTRGEMSPIYVVQTSCKIIERCMLMTTDPGDLVLDPTCGSGTTAYVAEQWGRRWITIDTSRVALALARARLMTGRFPYYYLADEVNPQIAQMNTDEEIRACLRQSAKSVEESSPDIRKGFVYKRVPHITLKSIANNEEIDIIHAKWQPKLDDLRAKINRAMGKNWEEWEIPRENPQIAQMDTDKKDNLRKSVKSADSPSPDSLLSEWWKIRRERQAEIDASIARHADTEILYDQPYEDPKRVRVTGPFTVESLSPHRTISVETKKEHEKKGTEGWKVKELGPNQFGHIIIENLKTAGVQNTVKNERLKFDTLEPFAGTWIHAVGTYTERNPQITQMDTDGKKKTNLRESAKSVDKDSASSVVRRAAICIGPEHGTVGPELIKEAAKEAVQGIGFDILIVCGFAFDPHVSEEAKRYGKLVVLPTRINADLQMGDEFLKKTGAANLFMVFGEPDVEVRRVSTDDADDTDVRAKKNLRKSAKSVDEKYVVEVKGVDVYDPTTGEIRSHSTDDIACWFIDTDYNGESFFVRHAYFCGGDEPYDKLKRALRAEIDEAAWSALYSTVSRPFDKPTTGKIAVKVINHYGDEVLKVYDV